MARSWKGWRYLSIWVACFCLVVTTPRPCKVIWWRCETAGLGSPVQLEQKIPRPGFVECSTKRRCRPYYYVGVKRGTFHHWRGFHLKAASRTTGLLTKKDNIDTWSYLSLNRYEVIWRTFIIEIILRKVINYFLWGYYHSISKEYRESQHSSISVITFITDPIRKLPYPELSYSFFQWSSNKPCSKQS